MNERTNKRVRTAEPAAMPEPGKKAFVFFNCDEAKNDHTKNIFYNHEIFSSTAASRKALWTKIQVEIAAGRISIDEANLDKVRSSITDKDGDPTEASQYIHCGVIHAFDCY